MDNAEKINKVIAAALYEDKELAQPLPIITIAGKTVATAGNFITINGLPKSRKTTFAFFFIAAAFKRAPMFDISVNISDTDKIMLIDTEQSIYDFSRQIKTLKYSLRSKKLPVNFSAYLFRQYEPDVILNSVFKLVEKERPKILFIDNLTELVINPNDMVESKKVIQFLKLLTAKFDCVIVCLLHLSKNNLQTLGNLGSYADRGGQSVLKVTLDKETQSSTLEPIFMRSDLYFDPISIVWDGENNEYTQTEFNQPQKSTRKFILNDLTEADHINRLSIVFQKSKNIVYAELVEEVKKMYGVGTNIAKQQVIPYLAGNRFIESEKGIYSKYVKPKKTK